MSTGRHTSIATCQKRVARFTALLLALVLAASACGTSVSSIDQTQQEANTGTSSGTVGDAGAGQVSTAAFTRGSAVLPRDLCMGNGVLLANVLHVSDLAAAGLDVPADSYVGEAQQDRGSYDVPNYPDRGQVNCGADLGPLTSFYFELHRDGRGLSNNYEVREQHTIAGTDFIIYRSGGRSTVWAEATFPNEYSTVGATSLTMGYSQRDENPALGEDDVASALLRVAELVLPLVAYDPPAPLIEEAAPQGPQTPDWWAGCDAGNFVFAGSTSDAIFAALGESPAETAKLDDNPLGGLLTDCRASNGDTRVSIIAVPPIGGLIESVDDVLAIEPGAQERTVAGIRAAVYSDDPTDLFPGGAVHTNIDGFSIIVRVVDRDGRQFTADQLAQMAVTAAEVFLNQL